MSKTKKQDNVFMQIERFANKEPYLLQVPENIGPILDKLMRDRTYTIIAIQRRSLRSFVRSLCRWTTKIRG